MAWWQKHPMRVPVGRQRHRREMNAGSRSANAHIVHQALEHSLLDELQCTDQPALLMLEYDWPRRSEDSQAITTSHGLSPLETLPNEILIMILKHVWRQEMHTVDNSWIDKSEPKQQIVTSPIAQTSRRLRHIAISLPDEYIESVVVEFAYTLRFQALKRWLQVAEAHLCRIRRLKLKRQRIYLEYTFRAIRDRVVSEEFDRALNTIPRNKDDTFCFDAESICRLWAAAYAYALSADTPDGYQIYPRIQLYFEHQDGDLGLVRYPWTLAQPHIGHEPLLVQAMQLLKNGPSGDGWRPFARS